MLLPQGMGHWLGALSTSKGQLRQLGLGRCWCVLHCCAVVAGTGATAAYLGFEQLEC
jgi:hypothetical protein